MTAAERPSTVRTLSDGDGSLGSQITGLEIDFEESRASVLRRVWKKVPTVWKALGLIFVIAGSGWFAHAFTGQYATQEDLKENTSKDDDVRSKIDDLARDVSSVKGENAATRTEIAEVKQTVKDTAKQTAEDIKTLTKYLIENSHR